MRFGYISHVHENEVSSQCEVIVKPSRCVRLKTSVKAGELALLPEGRVVVYGPDKRDAMLATGVVELDLQMLGGPERGASLVAVAPAHGMESACPWWFATTTKEADEANVKICSYKATMMGGVDPVPQDGVASTTSDAIVAVKIVSSFAVAPALVGTTALEAGTVLKRYVAASGRQG